MNDYTAGSGSQYWNYTDPHNDLTHQWMMEANAFNAEQAQITRDWQEKMSNTGYQRAMADMEKAGLNPILAGSLGPASTPGGATATANFTGAGATSSGGGSSWSRSIADNIWNMGMDAINSAGKEAFGFDLNDIVQKAGSYVGRLISGLSSQVENTMLNGASSSNVQSSNMQKHAGRDSGSNIVAIGDNFYDLDTGQVRPKNRSWKGKSRYTSEIEANPFMRSYGTKWRTSSGKSMVEDVLYG